jgi:glyoxylate reductase
VGFDNIDVPAATARGIPVGNTPDVLTDATADFAFALLMAVARRIPEGERYVHEGKWKTWGPRLLLGVDIKGATLGLIGLGRIGKAMARRAAGFDMRVIYYDPKDAKTSPDLKAKRVDFETLLKESDFISIHTPLTPDTRHLIDADAFSKMKSSAVLINTARGPLVDEQALADALESNELFGAGLDVYENEPAVNGKLKQLKNTVLLPHLGSATGETRRAMAMMTVQSVRQALAGRKPQHLIPEWKEKLKKDPLKVKGKR